MRTSIILGSNRLTSELETDNQERQFLYCPNAEEAYLYQLDHPGDVDSYILDFQSIPVKELSVIIRNIEYLNELVRIFISKELELSEEAENSDDNISFYNSADDISSGLKSITGGHRHYSRVKWPVSVRFWLKEKPDKKIAGSVISISSGGCLIMSDNVPNVHEHLIMTIIFKDFDFLVEGSVVRTETNKFAVELEKVSSQTRNLIQEIINEKILVELKGMN